jgi:hypothetical protein
MNVDLDERPVANTTEAVNLSSLDDEDVASAGLEFLTVDRPEASALPDKLDFIVRMSMRPRTAPRKSAEEECGDVHVAVVCTDELVRAALKRQILLTDAIHARGFLWSETLGIDA